MASTCRFPGSGVQRRGVDFTGRAICPGGQLSASMLRTAAALSTRRAGNSVGKGYLVAARGIPAADPSRRGGAAGAGERSGRESQKDRRPFLRLRHLCAAARPVRADPCSAIPTPDVERACGGGQGYLRPQAGPNRNPGLVRVPLSARELARFDAVVLDPPRAGAMAQVKQLARSRVPRIAYVSCDAASFARDARVLIDGGFRLDWLVGVDQFLWSAHIELAAAFARN